MQFVDSHCHIDVSQFDQDRELVLHRAQQAGVYRLINPSTDLNSSRRVVEQTEKYPNVYAAIGFHPYDAAGVDSTALAALTDLAKNPKVVAIGEIGLDFYRDRASKQDQYRAFELQLTLAAHLNLPVIIHQRDAAHDTMAILHQWANTGTHSGLVLHAFSGDTAMVEEAVSPGFYIGIGGPVTFTNAKNYPNLIPHIPLNRLLLETDSPYLSPHPYRGQRNEPARLALVADKIATLLGIPVDQVARQTTLNAETLFKLPQAVQL